MLEMLFLTKSMRDILNLIRLLRELLSAFSDGTINQSVFLYLVIFLGMNGDKAPSRVRRELDNKADP